MYFAAREPAVILSVREAPFGGFAVGVLYIRLVMPGVDLPTNDDGVTRPFEKEAEGVLGIE